MIKFKDYEQREKKFIQYVLNYSFLPENILEEGTEFFGENKVGKIISNTKLKIIISDNIRIGLLIKIKKIEISIILPHAYINNLVSVKDLKKHGIIEKNYSNYNILNYSNIFHHKNDLSNVELKNSSKKNLNIIKKSRNKVLILGPYKRNKTIIEFLRKDNCIVKCTQKKDISNFTDFNDFDFIFSSGYAYKISRDVVRNYKNRIINLHASFLPWGKGIGTLFFSMLKFEPLGLSIHLIDKDFDTGNILCRKILKPRSYDTTRTYYNYSLKELDKFFIKSWKIIKLNKFLSHNQKSFRGKAKYYTRNQFEKLISKLYLGYDTKLFDLSVIGLILKHNKIEKKKITNLIN